MSVFAKALRAHLDGAAIATTIALVLGCVLAAAVIPATGEALTSNKSAALVTDSSAWERAAPFLSFGFFAPAILVALRIRGTWPFLGPGDEGLALVRVHAKRPLAFRAQTCAAVLLALLALHALAAATIATSLTLRGAPPMHTSDDLELRGTRFLVKPGDAVHFELEETPANAQLRFEARTGYGLRSVKIAVVYEVIAPDQSILPFVLRESGDTVLLEVASKPAGTWTLRRTSVEGTGSDFLNGRASIETGPTSLTLAVLLLGAARLPWALGMVALALALARILAPPLHGLCIGALSVISLAAPGSELSDHLARASAPTIQQTIRSIPPVLILACLALLAAGVLLPFAKPRQEELVR